MHPLSSTQRHDGLKRLALLTIAVSVVAFAQLVGASPAQAQATNCDPSVPAEDRTDCRPICDTDAEHPARVLTASFVVQGTASGVFSASAMNPDMTAGQPYNPDVGPRECATLDSAVPPTWTWTVKQWCTFHCEHSHFLVQPGGTPLPPTANVVMTPDPGSHLLGWSAGGCAPPTKPADPRMACAVKLTADTDVEATLSDTPDATPPTAPKVSKVSSKRFQTTIRWAASTDTWLAGYEIFRNGRLYARRGPSARQLTATSLLCNTRYTWRVDAFDGSNTGRGSYVRIRTGECAKVPPNTVLHVVPPKSTRQKSAYFHWGAVRFERDLARFKSQCRLDGDRIWRTCRPGKTYYGLRAGYHTVRVRTGLDGQGWDRTPAKYTWRVRA